MRVKVNKKTMTLQIIDCDIVEGFVLDGSDDKIIDVSLTDGCRNYADALKSTDDTAPLNNEENNTNVQEPPKDISLKLNAIV